MNQGDVIALGKHRLLCGDAFNVEQVDALLQGEKPAMLYMDPPYGIGLRTDYDRNSQWAGKYPGGTRRKSAGSYVPVIGDEEGLNYQYLIGLFPKCKEQFWWGADYYRDALPCGGSWIVWDKRLGGTFDAMWGSCFELCWSKRRHRREIVRERWVGFYGCAHKSADDRRYHPTQKPIALAEWFISRYSKEGDIICDLFGGSGSTLLACERLNRRCLMAEISPDYCQVIIDRYERLTQQPSLLDAI